MRTLPSSAFLLLLAFAIAPKIGIAQTCVGVDPSPCLGSLVISELAVLGPGGASDEFVEIYNRGAGAVDASGVEIAYASSGSTTLNARTSLPPSTIIPPRSFYLAASTSYSGGAVPDLLGWSIGFSSAGGAVALRAGNTVLDLLGWESPLLFEGTPFPMVHGPTSSFERKAQPTSTTASMDLSGPDQFAGNGWDSDTNSIDFILRFVAEPQNSLSPMEPTGPVAVPALSPASFLATVAVMVVVGVLAASRRSGDPGHLRA